MLGTTPLLSRPMPKLGESLLSFLIRISQENDIPILLLLNSLRWDEHYIQRDDFRILDVNPASVIDMTKLSSATGYPLDQLLQMSMTNVLGMFSHSQNISRSRFMSGLIRDFLFYCPSCLEEKPILPLIWRVEGINMCIRHGTYLQNQCSSCGRKIKYIDLKEIGICPYCERPLKVGQLAIISMPDIEWKQQEWLNNIWCQSISHNFGQMEPQEIAMKLLYILNEFKSTYSQDTVSRNLVDAGVLRTLLQHARGSLLQTRTLHIKFILDCLYKYELSLSEFAKLLVPQKFFESIHMERTRLTEQISCQAPWCRGFKNPGTLVKTGTTVKERSSGEKLLYYTFCTACGCEYAMTETGNLKERTYFIQFYDTVIREFPGATVREIGELPGFTKDKIKRCIAYFATRTQGITVFLPEVKIDDSLINRFLIAIESRENLKTIQRWSCWNSYQHFLTYRFHITVMLALNELCRTRPHIRSHNSGKQRVQITLQQLIDNDEDITIGAISRIIGVSPETIRYWGCNFDIAEAKKEQRIKRLEERKEEIFRQVEYYLNKHATEIVSSSDLYKHLGQQRVIIWRIDPQITMFISEKVKCHNRTVLEGR